MHSPLEQYIETVETRLRALPPEQRNNEVEEIRQHLESMVAAHVELGYGEQEAVELSLTQFGKAERVGKDLNRVHLRNERRLVPIQIVLVILLSQFVIYQLVPIETSALLALSHWPDPVVRCAIVLFPSLTWLVSGWITGLLLPRRAALGLSIAFGIGMVQMLAIPDLAAILRYLESGFCWSYVLRVLFQLGGARAGAAFRQKRGGRTAPRGALR